MEGVAFSHSFGRVFFTRTGVQPASSAGAGFRPKTLSPLPHVDEMPGDRRGGRHRRRDEVGAALEALAALEIAVRGGSAALLRLQLVRVHGKAHRAARLAPFEASCNEDLVEAFGF